MIVAIIIFGLLILLAIKAERSMAKDRAEFYAMKERSDEKIAKYYKEKSLLGTNDPEYISTMKMINERPEDRL